MSLAAARRGIVHDWGYPRATSCGRSHARKWIDRRTMPDHHTSQPQPNAGAELKSAEEPCGKLRGSVDRVAAPTVNRAVGLRFGTFSTCSFQPEDSAEG